MELIEFLNHPEIWEIVQQYNKTKLHKKQVSYNLFTISSYNSYLENFHSDIIASLLDPQGLHQQGYTFLNLFIEYLNKHYSINLLNSDFQHTIVTRETGRIDIWIRDEVSKQCIIIENKINNAQDMEDQIKRYSDYSETYNYEVKAIIYLSLDGNKKAPKVNDKLDLFIKNIGAFTNSSTKNDLVHGWLQPCLKNHGNEDSFSVIHQYIKLIQHLANQNMDTTTMESYYQFLSTENGFEIANTIMEMNGRLNNYRVNKFANSISDIAPFKSQTIYQSNAWLFMNYVVSGCRLKLDVWFEDKSALIVFWNTDELGLEGRLILTEKLCAMNLLNEFENEPSNNGNGYLKVFNIGTTYNTLNDVDNAVLAFVQKLMKDLQTT
jgi:hypothetical protein